MADQVQLNIIEQHRNQSTKLIYYIIALAVASIGFSVSQTMGYSLSFSQIPLGLAVLCWGISIYLGLTYLNSSLHILLLNDEAINCKKGNIRLKDGKKILSPDEAHIKLMNDANKESDRCAKYPYDQRMLLYVGIISFLIWRIIEMYLISTC